MKKTKKEFAPMDCSHCNEKNVSMSFVEDVLTKMIENKACFNCNFWLEKVEAHKNDPRCFVEKKTWYHFYASPNKSDGGFQGFGGLDHNIVYEDGTSLKCANLWHNGTVPEHMRHLFHKFAERREVDKPKLTKEDFA